MENKTALEDMVIYLGSRRLDIVTHPHIKPFVRTAKLKEIDSLIDKLNTLIQKDKEQRKALVIESYNEGSSYGFKLGSNQGMKIDEIKMTAEQYYKQKYESNE